MVVSDIKMSQKLKNKGQFSIEKDIYKKIKICCNHLKGNLNLKVSCVSIKNRDRQTDRQTEKERK